MRLAWRHSRLRAARTARYQARLFRRPCRWHWAGRIAALSSPPYFHSVFGQQGSPDRWSHSLANDISQPFEAVYIPEVDLEDFEEYTIGGYHPIAIGDTFQDGRYHVVHKLGFGGYSAIWLARDKKLNRYVSLKVLVADESAKSTEGDILRLLHRVDSTHTGQRFIPHLLDEFSLEGPNGRHVCLVQEPASCSIAASKEDSVDFMFPIETARSIAAQLIMGLSYLHSRGICHGGRLSYFSSLLHCSHQIQISI